MMCRLFNFALVVVKLLMFKVCGKIGVTKIDFSNTCERQEDDFSVHFGLLTVLILGR